MNRRLARLIELVFCLLACAPASLFAQAAWDYTPYQARIWIARQATPQIPAGLEDRLHASLSARTRSRWGGVLHLQVQSAPAKLRSQILTDLDRLTAEMVAASVDASELEADKIYLTAITHRGGAIVVRLRELDCQSRQLGPIVERSVPDLAELATALADAVAESFTPLARIEQVEDGKLTARLRAGGLITNPESPANIEPGMVLRPVIRRNDRAGQPAKGGIQAIPWSFLTVEERHNSTLECLLRSGYRSAIPSRGGVRLQRLALLVRPERDATRLVLRSRGDRSKPLAGYEIYRRLEVEPQTAESQSTALLGQTDEQGSLTIPRGDSHGLETLVVKNGRQLLARLPLVPGYEEMLTAYLVDDDGRLAAEGYVEALSSRVIDLVARREILAAQIRARVKDGKHDEAQKLLEDFRRLSSRTDLTRDLDQFRQQVATGDKTTQERIDRVFADAQKLLLLKPLSDDLLAQLMREVAAARPGSE